MLFLPAAFGSADDNYHLSQEQLADLVQPAVVRIVTHVTGKYSLPAFDIDLKTFEAVEKPKDRPFTDKVDSYLLGSGFVVRPDGYIVTNSHVVSKTEIENEILGRVWAETLLKKISTLSLSEAYEVEKRLEDKFQTQNQQDLNLIGGYILGPMKAKSKFEVVSKWTVLKPTAAEDSLAKLVESGFDAQVLSLNPDFAKDQRDVALIKIDQNNLPTLPLAAAATLSPGQKIFIFGYPSTATFNGTDFLQPSFTSGVISAVKNSDFGDFKIYQTEAKISTGSSGGPLIDQTGYVQAIITFESSQSFGQGDNFAFALPVELVRQMLQKNNINNQTGSFYEPLLQAFISQNDRHCKTAIGQFATAKKANSSFIFFDKIQKYIDACKNNISEGSSLDSKWDNFKNEIKTLPAVVWLGILIIALLLAVFITVLIRQSSRLKKEEAEIKLLEAEYAKDHSDIVPSPSGRDKNNQNRL